MVTFCTTLLLKSGRRARSLPAVDDEDAKHSDMDGLPRGVWSSSLSDWKSAAAIVCSRRLCVLDALPLPYALARATRIASWLMIPCPFCCCVPNDAFLMVNPFPLRFFAGVLMDDDVGANRE
jgi:hypothetical protein